MFRNEENAGCVPVRKRYALFFGIMLNLLLIAAAPGISRAATPQVSAGSVHSVELRSDGTVWTWGQNTWEGVSNPGSLLGLGDSFVGLESGSTVQYSPIAQQVTGISGVTAISAGDNHTLALKSDGTVWAWGQNDHGQLGSSTLNGTASYSSVPIQVTIPTNNPIVAIAAGTEFSLAIDSTGVLWAWGSDDSAQLGGDDALLQKPLNLSDQFTPVSITALYADLNPLPKFTAIAAGESHALAVDSTGLVWSWGSNSNGQLGNATTNGTCPVQVPGLSGVKSVAAGDFNSFAIMSNGTVAAWGSNAAGQLGIGSTADSPVPVTISTLTGVTAISAGRSQTLALKSDGTIWAWGANTVGELGNGSSGVTAGSTSPLANGVTGATSCSAGFFFSLALKSNGTAWAWGDNSSGELGNATFDPPGFGTANPTPSVVIPVGDMNGDGQVTAADALLALRIAVGLDQPTSFELLVGEVNGDGQIASQITAASALSILRQAVGL